MRAPWDGGLDQVVLTIFSIWDRVRLRFSLSWATTVRLPTLSSDKSRQSKGFVSINNCAHCAYVRVSICLCVCVQNMCAHCKGRSFWRRTGLQTAQSPRRQSTGLPRHLYPDCQRRNPGKPSQRTQTTSSSRGKKREKEKQILGFNNASCHVDYKNKKTLLHNVIICRTNSTCFISCKSLRTLTACDRMCSRQWPL